MLKWPPISIHAKPLQLSSKLLWFQCQSLRKTTSLLTGSGLAIVQKLLLHITAAASRERMHCIGIQMYNMVNGTGKVN